jgi:hypothetical protein
VTPELIIRKARVAISYELPRHPSTLPQAPQLHPTFLPETPTFLKAFIKSDMSLLSRTFQRSFKTIPTRVTGIRIRTMASAAAADKFEWLVIVPDQPGKLEKRLEVRPWVPHLPLSIYIHFIIWLTPISRKHFDALKPAIDSGFWKMGGESSLFLSSLAEMRWFWWNISV